nr:uncharacterized protein LOC103239974 [Chlorocebus sabaeus]
MDLANGHHQWERGGQEERQAEETLITSRKHQIKSSPGLPLPVPLAYSDSAALQDGISESSGWMQSRTTAHVQEGCLLNVCPAEDFRKKGNILEIFLPPEDSLIQSFLGTNF